LIAVKNYVSFGYPSKSVVNDIIRKRAFIKNDKERIPLSDNTKVEELLGKFGVICVEDIIEEFMKCNKLNSNFEEVNKAIWPIQLAPLKETSDKANTEHEATKKELKKRNTTAVKGGYLGNLGSKINEFVAPLI
jgi:large subunit ribosomal protein L7e